MKTISSQTALVLSLVFLAIMSCNETSLKVEEVIEGQPILLKNAKISNQNYLIITQSTEIPEGLVKKLSGYGEIVKQVSEIGLVVLKTENADLGKELSVMNEIQSVIPDFVLKGLKPCKFYKESAESIGSDETYFMYQWALEAIDAPEAWNAGATGRSTRVFILDSGIDADHPDLYRNINTSLSTSFIEGEEYDIADGYNFNHGTHVAGIIAGANNGQGIIGVAPNAEIVAVKVLSEETGSGPVSAIVEGIVYAANNHADVINMSLGFELNKNGFFLDENNNLLKVPSNYILEIILLHQRAVDYAFGKGAVLVTSAGNDAKNADKNRSEVIVPADLRNVIAVSATAPVNWLDNFINGTLDEIFDFPASYSNFGRSLIDIAAPGGDDVTYPTEHWYYDMVFSTINGGWGWAAGTSMAAPHVAGVAALIIDKNKGNISPREVRKILLKTADKYDENGKSLYFGKGRVNAYRAVSE